MKVGLLVPGGVDRSGEYRVIPCLLWLIERLARIHELHVFALRQERGPVRYRLLGASVHVIGARPHRLRMVGAVLAEHARGRFDVLHAVWAVPSGIVAAVVRRALGVPVLLHVTGGDLADLPDIDYGARRSRAGRWTVALAVRGATRVTVPSADMQAKARACGFSAERVPMGVALDRWPPRPPRPRDLSRPARLIHVANLNRVKDQGALLRAVRIVGERFGPFRLDIVGEDTLGGRIQALSEEYGLADVVEFHGFLPQPEVRRMVERSDLLVVSSRHEADPVVMLEAAVAGVPTVSTAVGHASDWDGSAAVAVGVGDDEALAQAIGQLLESDEERMRLAVRAQERATAEDADWTARRVAEIYEDMVRPR